VQAELPPGFSLNLPPDTALPPQESAHFHDRLTPRLGVEQRLALARRLTLALRGGYAHEVSPLSTPQSAHLVDSARHLLGLGVALTWQRPWSLATLELATHALWAHHAERKLQSLASSGPFAFTAQGDLLGAGLTLTLGFR
jgi:hypothetical protein